MSIYDIIDNEIQAEIDAIVDMQPPPMAHAVDTKVEVSYFDPKYNLIGPNADMARKEFMATSFGPVLEQTTTDDTVRNDQWCQANTVRNDQSHTTSVIVTPLIPTTISVGGFFANLVFHEEDAIKRMEPDDTCVVLKCNYGKKISEGYVEPQERKKSNRGRKKQPKPPKKRKHPGSGEYFYSQLSFDILQPIDDEGNYKPKTNIVGGAPQGFKLYPFKVFRNGEIQLPGVIPADLDNVINSIHHLAGMFNKVYSPALNNIYPVNINHNMKNYKFRIVVPTDHCIDLLALNSIIVAYRQAVMTLQPPNDKLSIGRIKYSRRESKILIKINTPNIINQNKETTLIVLMSGKVNILGSYDNVDTQKIYSFVEQLVQQNPQIIVRAIWALEQQQQEVIAPLAPRPDNVVTEDDIDAIKRYFGVLDVPKMTAEDLQALHSINAQLERELAAVGEYCLRQYLGDTFIKIASAIRAA
jgi:hypothetical protein